MLFALVISYLVLLLEVGTSHASSQPQANISAMITNHGNTATAAATITAAATFHCDYRGQDPDLGIASPFCECGQHLETESWPMLTPSAWIAQDNIYSQCAYTAAPACLSCISMGYYNGKCVSVTDCNTQKLSNTESIKDQSASVWTSLASIPSGAPAGSSRFIAGPITTAPLEVLDCKNSSSYGSYSNSTCALRNAYCSLGGSEHALDGLRDVCVLWDKTCCGNSALAPGNYWHDDLSVVTSNGCFLDYSPDCTKSNPPGRESAFAEFKNWMRGPQCFASNPLIAGDPNDAMVYKGDEFLNVTCCGDNCQIVADKVDVYYWPDPLADTSCSSIVGSQVSNVADGATTDSLGHIYWGCTVWGTSLGIMADQSSAVVETASLTSVAGISYKAYVFNPWDPSQCGNTSVSLSSMTNSTMQSRSIPASLNRRGHSLIITNSAVSTTVLGNYTFTSPSIYLNFQGLSASDNCGKTHIPSTMIAFSPGELSTITGQIGKLYATPQAFNPKDLPCPPFSIMSQNWYTPLPGVPYRPYFAFPDKLRQISDFKYCNAFYFSVFDPPRTLGPATAMDPAVTTDDPTSASKAPMPSSLAQQPVQVTDPPERPIQTAPPAAGVSGEPPKQTSARAVAPGPLDPPVGINIQPSNVGSGKLPLPPVPSGDPTSIMGAQQQGDHSDSNEPNPVKKPSTTASVANTPAAIQAPSNPNDESPAQMSALHEALGPAPPANLQGQPAATQPAVDQHTSPYIQPNSAIAPESSDPHTEDGDQFPQPAPSNPQHPDPPDSVAESGAQSPQPESNDPQNTTPDSSNPPLKNGIQSMEPAESDKIPLTLDSNDSLPPEKGKTPTTIQLGPGPDQKPTTIALGSRVGGRPNGPGPAANINEHAVSAANPNDGSAARASITDAANPLATVAGHILTITDPSAVSIAGTVLTPGGDEATVAGTPVSLASGGNLVIGTRPEIFTAGGQILTANSAGFKVGGTTVAAGSPAVTLAGIPVSLGASGILVVGSITTTLAVSSPTTVLTIGGQTFTADPTAFAIAGTTVSAGGPAVLVSGTPVSLGASGALVVGSSTTTLAGSSPSSVFTVGGQVFTANPTAFAIAGTTLSAGGPAVLLSGTPVSLGSLGDLVIGSSMPSSPDHPHSSVFDIGGQRFTANPTRFAVAGTTLSAGGAGLTISSTPISLDPSGSLIVGTSTIPLEDPTPSIFTTDGQVHTVQNGGKVAINDATLTDGAPATTTSGVIVVVESDGMIMRTNTVPLPTINGSASLSSASISSTPSSLSSSAVPHTTGTGKPKAGAASYRCKAPSVIWWPSLLMAIMICII